MSIERMTSGDAACEEHSVHVDGHPIRVVTRGSGPPLLMINGLGAHVAMWGRLAAELSLTHKLVLFDAPGCGRSPTLPKPRRMPGLARLVVQILDTLDLPRVDVMGYSWGGALAQQLAHDAPTRVRRLVLASTTPGLGGRPPALGVSAAMLSPMRYRSRRLTRAIAGHIYGGDHRRPAAESGRTRHQHWNDYPPGSLAYAQQLFAISGWTSLPWLRRIDAPTLVIAGDDDPLAPSLNARLMARLIPRCELRIIAGGGHLWLLDHAPLSSAIIEQFLAEMDA